MTRNSLLILSCLVLTLILTTDRMAIAAEPAKDGPTREELENKFAETMSGATLVGRFTTREMGVDKPLAEDRYTLGKVHKLPNGFWSFETRIQYGERDVKLPLALEVKWAGDTPVITLDNVLVPGIGTFTSRVLVHNDEYAGTWAGGNHGGQMFGRIMRAEKSNGK